MAKWTVDDMPNQTDRTILVMGANSGLGLRSAEALASRGARLLMGCRNQVKAAAALEAGKNFLLSRRLLRTPGLPRIEGVPDRIRASAWRYTPLEAMTPEQRCTPRR